MELGRLGVWVSPRGVPPERLPAAAALAERLGYGTLWLGGSPRLTALRPALEGSERLVAATSIVNVWTYDPAELDAEFAALDAEFPGRILVGIGIGHPEYTAQYASPLAAMRTFLDGLDALAPHRRCLAALAPQMLELSRLRALGASPYFTPPEHTREARKQLGDGPLLAPELAFALGDDPASAHEYAQTYLALGNYRRTLERFGMGEDDVDKIVPHGSAEHVADTVRAHLDAGADHVCVQALGEDGIPERSWSAVIEAL